MIVIPAVLEFDRISFFDRIEQARLLGAKMVHLDVMDGEFTKRKNYAVPSDQLARCGIDLEIHLMVENSTHEMLRWCGLPNVKRVIKHYETLPGSKLRRGYFRTLAFNPHTRLPKRDGHFRSFEHILLMGVDPGASGQPFQNHVINRVKKLHAIRHPRLTIGVDGGINRTTAPQVRAAGADVINVASFLWQSSNPKETWNWLNKL